MTTILDQLAAYARERTRRAKKKIPLAEIRRQALMLPKGTFAFEKALRKPEISFICECKKASPSKGVIAPDFPYLEIAKEYEAAGAECISVLTEPKWFLGSNEYLCEIESMIYEAKLLGASAVLLICSILRPMEIEEYINICDELGLSALVEIHDEDEAEAALKAGARMIGVNNRNLKDFSVDMDNSLSLRKRIPSDRLFVSESGIGSVKDMANLCEIGADAVLVGEMLMRAADKKAVLAELRGAYDEDKTLRPDPA